MIRSWSQVSAFKKQILELGKPQSGTGYLWRKRSDNINYLYCDGQVIGQAKSLVDLYELVKAHATRTGKWFKPELAGHYFHNVDGLWRLYIDGRYAKKSRNKAELELYVEVISWLDQSGLGKSWGKR